ncbi:MAG TPA: hypothetical protein VFG50_06990, partial [Rhodothermales bacterium]|nr:hypothetical protein [Rhodothermales bacterium]
AGVGGGVWPDVDAACDRTIQVTGRTEPDLDNAQTYTAYHHRYRELYPALKPTFDDLAELTDSH